MCWDGDRPSRCPTRQTGHKDQPVWNGDVAAAGRILFELVFLRPPEADESAPRHAFGIPVANDLKAIALKALSADPALVLPLDPRDGRRRAPIPR